MSEVAGGSEAEKRVDDIRRQMAAVKEQLNPDWFMILSDQGFLPLDVMKEQVELFGTKIMPEVR